MHTFPCVFQLVFQAVFCWTWAIRCHPSTHCDDKGIEWRLPKVKNTLIVLSLLFFLMLLVDLRKGLIRIRVWGMMCHPYVEKCFLTTIPQSSRRNVQSYIVSSIDFSFKMTFIDWQKCGFYLNIPADLFHWWASESLTELCLIKVQPPSLHLRLRST